MGTSGPELKDANTKTEKKNLKKSEREMRKYKIKTLNQVTNLKKPQKNCMPSLGKQSKRLYLRYFKVLQH